MLIVTVDRYMLIIYSEACIITIISLLSVYLSLLQLFSSAPHLLMEFMQSSGDYCHAQHRDTWAQMIIPVSKSWMSSGTPYFPPSSLWSYWLKTHLLTRWVSRHRGPGLSDCVPPAWSPTSAHAWIFQPSVFQRTSQLFGLQQHPEALPCDSTATVALLVDSVKLVFLCLLGRHWQSP